MPARNKKNFRPTKSGAGMTRAGVAAYASKICAGKIKDPSGVKRKDFKGPKPSKAMGGRIPYGKGGGVCKKGMGRAYGRNS